MLLDPMAKSNVEGPKGFDLSVERLVAGSSATLELSQFDWIMSIGCTNDCVLSAVSIVTNNLLADGDHVFEAFLTEDRDVVACSRKGTIHPNKSIVEYRNPKLIV